jgi:hypothetical protein
MTTSLLLRPLAAILSVCASSYALCGQTPALPPDRNEVTVLYDAFSARTDLNLDFGYSVLVGI